jgi:pimeloyl-ACP methyl ester carboxylesterase
MEKAVADELNIAPLSYDEVRLSYRYQFPVHAVGYNWLQDNADSAKRLHERIEYFMDYYRSRFGYTCEKVILVTHSMGGLVARHYSEVLDHRDKVLGIVHGVMPATGAATAYKRVKAGTDGDWGTRQVLGLMRPRLPPSSHSHLAHCNYCPLLSMEKAGSIFGTAISSKVCLRRTPTVRSICSGKNGGA